MHVLRGDSRKRSVASRNRMATGWMTACGTIRAELGRVDVALKRGRHAPVPTADACPAARLERCAQSHHYTATTFGSDIPDDRTRITDVLVRQVIAADISQPVR